MLIKLGAVSPFLFGPIFAIFLLPSSVTAQTLPLGNVSAVTTANCSTLHAQRNFDVNPNTTSCFTATLNCPGVGTAGVADPLPFNMRRMFDTHLKRVHTRKDASQAAAQIVRETTEQ